MPMNYWGVTHPTLPNNDASEENISEMEGLEERKMIPWYQWHSLCMLLQGQKVFLTVPYRSLPLAQVQLCRHFEMGISSRYKENYNQNNSTLALKILNKKQLKIKLLETSGRSEKSTQEEIYCFYNP